MADAELTLVGDSRFSSPWVLTVWVALKEKARPFAFEGLDLEKGEHRGDYRKRTLAGKVPSLRHGGVAISESLAILEYLEEVFPPPHHQALFPVSAADRAHDREILSWLRSDLAELRRCMPYEGMFFRLLRPDMTEKAREEARALVAVAARRAAGKRTPTLADFELAFTLRRLIHYGEGLEARPDLAAWSDEIWKRPSVQSWVTAPRPALG